MLSRQLNRPPAWSLAVSAMFSVQIGAAISIKLFPSIGVIGATWVRLAIASIVLIIFVRPNYFGWSFRELKAPIILGLVSAGMTLSFFSAINRIPLGTSVAIEFLGPLFVAALHSKDRSALAWPLLALGGVLLLTEPWKANADFVGFGFAAMAGAFWGLYIVITQHVGDQFSGLDGLAISLPVAAVATSIIGVPRVWGHLTTHVIILSVTAAILLPLIPWILEVYALRRLTKSAFGTLMALEPAIALLIGVTMLSQKAAAYQLLGIVLVVAAGIGAERNGKR